ncbi:MAG: hypothetical protein PVJ67_07180, partial [Candidatus Pacearchaeota archaeon]
IGFYFFYKGTVEAIGHDYVAAKIFFSVGVISFIFAWLSKFKKFSFFGIVKCELWNDKQKEAAKIIDTTKSLLFLLSESAYMSLGGIGRFAGSVPISLVFDTVNNIDDMLRKIGASQEEIIKIRAPFDRLIIFDIAQPIRQQIQKDIDEKAKKLQFIDDDGVGCWKKGGNDLVVKATTDLNKALTAPSSTNEDLLLRIKNYCIDSPFFDDQYYNNLRNNTCFLDFKNLENYIKNRRLYDKNHFLQHKK